MQEEQDTCRICSAPAEPDQPLFYPCKCSGTIRYIHQDCLKEWLAHSKKKTCDLCKHPYSFTKVYAKDMPDRIPILLFLRQFSHQVVSALGFCLRAALVATVWLAALPWATIWTWRMYFALGNTLAWWISALPRPLSDIDFYFHTDSNATSANVTSSTETTDEQSITLKHIFAHPLYKSISSDIFSGQIIASVIVLSFVAIFLLREWISQNARPGVFEDGDGAELLDAVPPLLDAPAPVPPPAQPPLPAPPPLPQPAHEPLIAEPAHERAPPIRDHHYGALRDDVAFQARVKKPRTRRDPSPEEPLVLRARGTRRPMSAREERKMKGHQVGRRRRIVDGEHSAEENVALYQDKKFRRLRYVARRIEAFDDELIIDTRRKSDNGESSPQSIKIPPPANFPVFSSEFTFTAPGPTFSPPPSSKGKEPALPSSSSLTPYEDSASTTSAAISPSVTSTQPDDRGSDDEGHDSTPTRTRSSTPALYASSDREIIFRLHDNPNYPPSPPPSGLRRPPLPSVTLPPSPIPSSSASIFQSSRGQTPLGSPSLATYRAPEELDAEPPAVEDYFVRDLQPDHFIDSETTAEEHRRYFRDASDGDDEDEDEDGNDEGDEEQGRAEAEVAQHVEIGNALALQAEQRAAAELAEAEMADGELDDEPDDVQWTDEDAVQEEEGDDDEGDEGEGVVQIREEVAVPRPLGEDLGAAAAAVPAPQRRELRVVLGENPELQAQEDFDQDVNVEDDMDGALEAIGLRGPLVGVFQNAILMTFILDTTIGLGVWLPFTIGKTSALLTLNPQRALQLLQLPLRIIRFITDPVVDTSILVVSSLIIPGFLRLVQAILHTGLRAVAQIVGENEADQLSELSTAACDRAMSFANQLYERTAVFTSSASDAPQAQPSSSLLYRALEEDTTIMRMAEPYFAPIGKNVRELSEEGKTTWIKFATGDTPNDRAFAVILGYAVVGLLLAIYLNILTMGSMRSAGRAVRNAVRQQLLVVKVAAFIIIELVIFPLGCGVMLDVCTVWLFPQGSFRSRAAFLMYAPLTAVFYHWVLGTMFMYQFAVLLSGCRGIMRTGAMWFIKDPQDQNFHPIRDILERPTFLQIRKLLLSAMMYGFVVASGVATVSGILRVCSQTIMPFRWKIKEPLSEVPIDLILLHLVLSYTVDWFRPRKALRRLGISIWKYLASRLRLSSYMFGGRYPAEEFTPIHSSWRSFFFRNGMQMDDAEAVHDGCFRRVPNNDNVALVRDASATADVLEDGTPVDEKARKLIDAQNAEAQKAKRNVNKDYTVVYMPPNFRYRVIAFLISLWTLGSILLATVLAAPILLGRRFFSLFRSDEVHDGYSFLVGFYLLWGCWLVGAALDRMDKRRQRRWADTVGRAEWPLYVVKRTLLWIPQAVYMAVMLGVVIPTLVGLVVELYMVQPVRRTTNPLMEPRIRMVDMWALGLFYSKIIVRSLGAHTPAAGQGPRLIRGIDRIVRNGWIHIDPMRATRDVIGPLLFGLLGMIVLPAATVWGITRYVTVPVDEDFLFLHVYPGIFTAAGLGHAVFAMSKVVGSWSQIIRDKEYLVEMRLRNLEPAVEKTKPKSKAKPKTHTALQAVDIVAEVPIEAEDQ